jgi:hypothetical protein
MKCDKCKQLATRVLKETTYDYDVEEYRCERCFRDIFVRAGWKRIKPQPENPIGRRPHSADRDRGDGEGGGYWRAHAAQGEAGAARQIHEATRGPMGVGIARGRWDQGCNTIEGEKVCSVAALMRKGL